MSMEPYSPKGTTPATAASNSDVPRPGRLDYIDITEIIAVLRRRLWIIAACVVVICALAVGLLSTTAPTYEATARVLLDIRQGQSLNMEAVVGALPSETNAVDTEVAIVGSPALAKRVIDTLDLIEDPEFNPTLEEPGFDPATFLRGLMSSVMPGDGEDDAAEKMTQDDIRQAVLNRFLEQTSVRRQGSTYIILVSFQSGDPAKAARIANAIAEAYLVDQLEAKFEATERVHSWLADRLATLRDEVTSAEQAVGAYNRENNLLTAGGELLNEQSLSELNAQLIQARADIAERSARLEQARQLAVGGGRLDTVAETLGSETIRTLREQQAEVIRERADLSSRYGSRHPEIVKINNELRDLNAQIEGEIRRIIQSLRNEVTVAEERARTMEAQLDEAKAESAQIKTAMVQLRQLEREAQASRTLYESFLDRFKETTEQKSLLEADARIIARATAPLDPVAPNKPMFMVVALALSGVVGLGAAFVFEQLDNRFRDFHHVEHDLGLPILAVIPRLTTSLATIDGVRYAPQDYHLLKSQSGFAEAFRTLDASLSLINQYHPPRTILFTSSVSGEGKSTSALCFARSVAISETSCVLIDADLRVPTIAEMAKVPGDVGLVDVLLDEASLDAALVRDPSSGLSILSRGGRETNPMELFGSRAFDQLLVELRARFDLVILDSAPLLPVADSRLLARKADACVMVLQWGKTSRTASAAAVRALRDAGAGMAGVVVSQYDVPQRRGHAHGDARFNQNYYGQIESS